MATLANKISAYAKANGVDTVDFENDVLLVNEGSGDTIKSWNLSIAQPTDEQLATYEASANTFEQNVEIGLVRKNLYNKGKINSWEDQLDEIYHDIDAWRLRIKSIKDANPKV